MDAFRQHLSRCPLVAILRGIAPAEAEDAGLALQRAGFAIVEVPLNSPEPFASIRTMVRTLPGALVGAGTVLTGAQVRDVHAAGARLVVAPNFDADVAAEAIALHMAYVPGVATASEAFAALKAGACALKLFPAEMIPPAAIKALRAVLPKDVPLLPVGGITAANMHAYRSAGADGFGIGSALYTPGLDAGELERRAHAFAAAWRGTIRV